MRQTTLSSVRRRGNPAVHLGFDMSPAILGLSAAIAALILVPVVIWFWINRATKVARIGPSVLPLFTGSGMTIAKEEGDGDPQGDGVAHRPLPPPEGGSTAVAGTVFDSLRNRPLAGAIVSIQEGAFADTTDESGRFWINSPGTGDFLLTVAHPQFPLIGLEPLHGSAQLRRGQTDTTDLATPGLAATLQRLCGVDRLDSTRALLVGRVEDSRSGQAIGDAVVLVRSDVKTIGRTGRIVTVGEKGTEWEVRTGPGGVFQVCGVPRGRSLDIRLTVRGGASFPSRLEADPMTIRELLIRHPE